MVEETHLLQSRTNLSGRFRWYGHCASIWNALDLETVAGSHTNRMEAPVFSQLRSVSSAGLMLVIAPVIIGCSAVPVSTPTPVQPRPLVIIVTATPEPTLTAIPTPRPRPTATPIRVTLGITLSAVTVPMGEVGYEFKFSPVDGRNRWISRSGLTIVELIGHRDDLEHAGFMFAAHESASAQIFVGLDTFFSIVLPGWDWSEWLREYAEEIKNGSKASTVVGQRRVTVSLIEYEGSSFLLLTVKKR